MEHNKKHLVYRDGVRMFDSHCPACVKEEEEKRIKWIKENKKKQTKCLVDDCENKVDGENVLCDFHNENLPF